MVRRNNESSNRWDQYFISLAYLVASKSKDPKTKIGTVIVAPDMSIVSTGYNGPPPRVNDSKERFERPIKHLFCEHSERNAIYRAKSSLKNCTLYTLAVPCSDCARAIISSDIKEVVVHSPFSEKMFKGRTDWNDSMTASLAMFKEALVRYRSFDGKRVKCIKGLLNGKEI